MLWEGEQQYIVYSSYQSSDVLQSTAGANGHSGYLVNKTPTFRFCPVLKSASSIAMLFEFVLFGFAIYKSIVSRSANMKINQRSTLSRILLNENIVYFAM